MGELKLTLGIRRRRPREDRYGSRVHRVDAKENRVKVAKLTKRIYHIDSKWRIICDKVERIRICLIIMMCWDALREKLQ
jgi:hypothetical protein